MERPATTLPMNYTYGLSIINSHLLGLYTYEKLERLSFFRMTALDELEKLVTKKKSWMIKESPMC